MAEMKAFRAMTFIGDSVRDALGERPHIRQGSVLIVARNKAAAVEEVEARLRHRGTKGALQPPALRDPDFRLAMGDDADALRAAGLLNAPIVLVMSAVARDAVVAVTHVGVRRIGSLRRVDGRSVFTPAGGEYRAADLPEQSVVAGDHTAYIKILESRPGDFDGKNWRGTKGEDLADWYIDQRIAEDAQVLRVGTGKED